MRGLRRAAALLLAPVASLSLGSSSSNQLVSFELPVSGGDDTISGDRKQLVIFFVDVQKSSDICGPATLHINHAPLAQDELGRGSGLLDYAFGGGTITAHWCFLCDGARGDAEDSSPVSQTLFMAVSALDGVALDEEFEFSVTFQQTLPAITAVEGDLLMPRGVDDDDDDGAEDVWDEKQIDGVLDENGEVVWDDAEEDFLNFEEEALELQELREEEFHLRTLIWAKETALMSRLGQPLPPYPGDLPADFDFELEDAAPKECDSIRCRVESWISSIKQMFEANIEGHIVSSTEFGDDVQADRPRVSYSHPHYVLPATSADVSENLADTEEIHIIESMRDGPKEKPMMRLGVHQDSAASANVSSYDTIVQALSPTMQQQHPLISAMGVAAIAFALFSLCGARMIHRRWLAHRVVDDSEHGRRFRGFRRRWNRRHGHRSTREERRARRAARREAFKSGFSALIHRLLSPFLDEEKEAERRRAVAAETTTVQEEIAGLREAAELVENLVAVEEGRGRGGHGYSAVPQPAPAPVVNVSYAGFETEEVRPPSYEEERVVADGFRYTPGSSDRTPSSAVSDTSRGTFTSSDRLGYNK